ncbi:hypothetical protein, partial [Armatimonas sp.]|uniref:hypothetical protein n=1 Tax=Armatimonas sp. TaxID=1872638 RepID=UPI00286C4222
RYFDLVGKYHFGDARIDSILIGDDKFEIVLWMDLLIGGDGGAVVKIIYSDLIGVDIFGVSDSKNTLRGFGVTG